MVMGVLNARDHKSLFRQGKMCDAFVKSKYDNGNLTNSECQKIFQCYTNPLLQVMDLSSTNTILRHGPLSF